MLALATGQPLPLSAVQLLWLNLVTNGGQDVALAFEKREEGLLDRPPRPVNEPIFDRLMIAECATSGITIGIVGFILFAWMIAHGWSEFEARNALLFLMVAFENVHVFNCRSEARSAFRMPFASNCRSFWLSRVRKACISARPTFQASAAFSKCSRSRSGCGWRSRRSRSRFSL